MRTSLLALAVAGVVLGSGSTLTIGATGGPTRPVGTSASTAPAVVARAAVDQHPAAVDGADGNDLSIARTRSGLGGTTIVRLDQDIDGTPVLGGQVVVAMDAKRRVLYMDGATADTAPTVASPTVSARRARTIAVATVRKGAGRGLVASEARLVIHDPEVMNGSGPPRARTAWEITVTRGHDLRVRVYVDARTGTPYQMMNLIMTAKSIAVCNAGNAAARVPCTTPDYVRFDSAVASGITEVDAAYNLAGATYDFYSALGRDSIDGAGVRLVSTVNWCEAGCPYLNAFWDGTQMVFGPGMASADDVMAHELTHGVTERTSNLFYWYQSGAINEALSDIMGELFDLQRVPAPTSAWTIGEGSPVGIIRSMANPPSYGDPDRITSPSYAMGASDNGGVHRNSGVANKTAYLIADGGTFNGQTVGAIGRTKSTALWYQTGLVLQMSSDYSNLANALEQTCDGFVALGQIGFIAADCTQVRKAVLATEMRTSPVTVPAVCPTGATRINAFIDGFDSGIATNWTTSATAGTNQWYPSTAISPDGNPMTWPTATAFNVRAVNTTARSASSLAMTNAVTVPTGGYLRFTHWHQFEYSEYLESGFQGWDGGVVEYSANGGAWTDVAGLATVNGYTGTINANLMSNNPLEGRAGFIGVSNGAVTTQVDVSSLAGQDVRFRFRQATDEGGGGYGWYIDEVDVHNCATAPEPPTVTVITAGDWQLSVAFALGGSGGAAPTNIGYSLDAGTTWTVRSPASTASPLVITGLTHETTYQVRLRVFGPGGTGGQSNLLSGSPTPPLVRSIAITSSPAAIHAFNATPPTIVTTPSVAGGDITYLSSTTGVCTVGAGTGQIVFTTAGTCSITASVAASANMLPATSLPVTFQVTAVAPAAPTITAITPADRELSVDFALAGTGGAPPNTIEFSTDDGKAWSARTPSSTASPVVIRGLGNGTAYDVRLRVIGPGGTGAQSNLMVGTPNGPVVRTIRITSAVAASYALDAPPPTLTATPSVAGGAITYTSSPPAVCLVDSATGVLRFAGTGTCRTGASIAASDNLLSASAVPVSFEVRAAAAPSLPKRITWRAVTSGITGNRTLTATIPAPRGTTLVVKATAAGQRAAKGTCRAGRTTARCSVRVTGRGQWTITTTPTKAGVSGKPVRSVVRVR